MTIIGKSATRKCSTPVLHHCQSVLAPVSVDVLTSVGAFSSFCHADTISHAR